MNILTPSELRSTLKISRTTEYRLLKHGMSSIGGRRLRQCDQEAAVAWFRTHAHERWPEVSINVERADFKWSS